MLQVAAAVVRRLEERRYFAARRAHGRLAGFWEFPGGKIESGETPEQCLVREMVEEFDMEISVESFYTVSEHWNEGRGISLYAYLAHQLGEGYVLRDHDQAGYYTLEELAAFEFAPADKPILLKLMEDNDLET